MCVSVREAYFLMTEASTKWIPRFQLYLAARLLHPGLMNFKQTNVSEYGY